MLVIAVYAMRDLLLCAYRLIIDVKASPLKR